MPGTDAPNASILFVDDDRDIREVFRLLLESAGYEVNLATDGLDAWHKLRERNRPPALMVVDLMMPVMDGEQFLKAVRSSSFASIPVVILSGHNAARAKANELHADACLIKPVDFEQVLEIVRRLVAAPPKSDAA